MKTTIKRQIILDTETTGMNLIGKHYEGHNIIEIGGVEIIDRNFTENNFHAYIKPNRQIDIEAFKVHGITNKFLANKPVFDEIADKLFNYISGSELVIHNASFDIDFIDYEFSKLHRNFPKLNSVCRITDTLSLANVLFPGKRNNLNSLCMRYNIDNNKRKLHGALLDAQILAKIYLAMTGGQISMFNEIKFQEDCYNTSYLNINLKKIKNKKLRIILAKDEDLKAHEEYLNLIENNSKQCLWRK